MNTIGAWSDMKNLLFIFCFVSLGIAAYQFTRGISVEAFLSIAYAGMFFAGGMFYKSKNPK